MVKTLEFFDVSTKKKFTTSDFTLTTVGKRKQKAAKATAPSGATAFRFVKKDFKKG